MSKELEALEKLNHTICLNNNRKTLKFSIDDNEHIDCKDVYEFVDCYNIIRDALERKDKLEKVVEIFRNKGVNELLTISAKNTVDEYNNNFSSSYPLTKEEYDLLKEVLR